MSNGKVVGFVCRFCALLSADLGPAADAQLKLETVELPCAGKVDARLLLEAFEKGADAVFIAGCPEHECMNLKGSARAKQRMEYVKEILSQVGIGSERVVMYNVSGTHGPRFATIAQEMAALLAEVGPSPLNIQRDGKETSKAL